MTELEVTHAHLETGRTRFGRDQIELIKSTIAPDATDDELALFVQVCERTGLDPFARQIYAIKRWNDAQRKQVLSFQTSIDGYRLIAQRSGQYAGQDGPYWCADDGQWRDVWLKVHAPSAAKVGVYRTGFVAPVVGIARFDEYAQRRKDGELTSMWERMPATMLAKTAEALALRKAFPADLSGVYTSEEMGTVDTIGRVVHPDTGEIIQFAAPETLQMARDLVAQLADTGRDELRQYMAINEIPSLKHDHVPADAVDLVIDEARRLLEAADNGPDRYDDPDEPLF